MATFLHSGSLGDVIYALPVVRALGGGRLFINPYGSWWKWLFGEPTRQLKRLLEAQTYIELVETWDGKSEVDFRLDAFRKLHIQCHRPATVTLSSLHLSHFGFPVDLENEKWLSAEPLRVARVVIHRSQRYHSPYFRWDHFIELYGQDAVFTGVREEYKEFTRRWGKIPYYKTDDLYELASVIAGSELFAGNESSPFAMAMGLKHKSVLEVSPAVPNCLFDRDNLFAYTFFDKDSHGPEGRLLRDD